MKYAAAVGLVPLFVTAVWSCASSSSSVPVSATPDSGTSADGSPPVAEQGPCAKALKLPVSASPLGAGRQLRFALSAEALSYELNVTEQEGNADAWVDGSSLVVRGAYVGGDTSVRVLCNNGEELRVALTIAAPVLSLLAEWGGAAQATPAPPSREYFSFWQDQGDANRLLVLGGFHYEPQQFTPSNDIWAFDLTSRNWTPVVPAGTLPKHGGARLVASPTERAAYLMGGVQQDGDTLRVVPMAKKLRYTGTTFSVTDAPLSGAAPESYTGSLVYDAKRARYLSVCGTTNAGPACDVHSYTESTGFAALPVAAGATPKRRAGFHFAMDAVNDRVVIFGGTIPTGNPPVIGDTWALQLSESPARWVKLFDEVPESAKRRNGGYVHDTDANRLFVWGGTADGSTSIKNFQVLDLTAGHERWFSFWPADAPAKQNARTSAMMLHDAAGKRLIMGMGNNLGGVFSDLHSLTLP